MRTAAVAIDSLLASVDTIDSTGSPEFTEPSAVESDAAEDFEVPKRHSHKSEGPILAVYEKYYEIWTNIEGGQYHTAAETINNLLEASEPIEGLAEDLERAGKVVLFRCKHALCESESFDASSLSNAVRAISDIEKTPCSVLVRQALCDKLDRTFQAAQVGGEQAAAILVRFHQACEILEISTAEMLFDQSVQAKIDSNRALDIAVHLHDGPRDLKPMSESLFKKWLEGVPGSPSATDLFSLCKSIAAVTTVPLPGDWHGQIAAKISLPPHSLAGMELLFSPVFGEPPGGKVEQKSSERLFVPMGLPRVLKLTH